MDLPCTSDTTGTPMREYRIGRGDYIVGGAHTLPFLAMDGAGRIRPPVFGEVWARAEGRPDMLPEIFSGMSEDPLGWAIAWRGLGADGVLMRVGDDPEQVASLVRMTSDATFMPIMVSASGNHAEVYGAVADAVDDSILILMCPDTDVAESMSGRVGFHVMSIPAELRMGSSTRLKGSVMVHSTFAFGEDVGEKEGILSEIRAEGVSGVEDSSYPLICDVTDSWNIHCRDEAHGGLYESESALCAMLCGADIVVVRSTTAADSAVFYGEELGGL